MSTKYFVANPEAVFVFPDGREVCNTKTTVGKLEYKSRTYQMLERQGMRCAICYSSLGYIWSQFDHQAGRGSGGGHRDDRIVVDGQWHNAALCHSCNTQKGSRRYEWIAGVYQPRHEEPAQ